MLKLKNKNSRKMMADLYHNILWSKYKAGVFSALFKESNIDGAISYSFYQIAETEGQRAGMGKIDISCHEYPYQLLYSGSYSNISIVSLIPKLFFKVLFSKADLVLLPGYYRPEHWGMLLACMLRGKKRAVFSDSTLRDKPPRFIVNAAKRVFLFLCDAAFTYGQRGRENLISLGVKPEKIITRCQAAALPESYKLDCVIANRVHNVSDTSSPRFLFVGRLSSDKSIDVLLCAFAKVIKSKPLAFLAIIGKGPDEDKLKALAENLGLNQRIEFLGGLELDAIALEYQKATCLVLPSRKEPWGLVANEALHYGCPVIVSDNCGCVPELFYDNPVGIVFETDNVEKLSEAMNKAPDAFGDVATVARSCLNVISRNTPQEAARQMHEGCLKILANKSTV